MNDRHRKNGAMQLLDATDAAAVNTQEATGPPRQGWSRLPITDARRASVRLAFAGPRLLSDQGHRYITHNLQRFRAHLIDRVFRRVMIGEIEVDDVDGMDTGVLQRYVVVGEGLTGPGYEHPRIPEPIRRLPDALHDLRRGREGVAFLVELQVFIPDHVEQHREQRRVPRQQVLREITRADERLSRIVEVAVVFAVDEQQIHADARRRGFEGVRDTEQHRDP